MHLRIRTLARSLQDVRRQRGLQSADALHRRPGLCIAIGVIAGSGSAAQGGRSGHSILACGRLGNPLYIELPSLTFPA